MLRIFVLVGFLLYSGLAGATSNGSKCTKSLRAEYFANDLVFDDNNSGLVTRVVPMTPRSLKEGYGKGLFPWIDNGDGTFSWYSPPERGVIFFKDVSLSKSLRKDLKKASKEYSVSFDKAFESVIRGAMTTRRKNENGSEQNTWITDAFVNNYLALHNQGAAHSVEVWDKKDKELVGGLYGVFVNGVFSGESMFTKRDNASKLALLSLIARMQAKGFQWIDIQEVSNISSRFGGRTISREEFFYLKEIAFDQSLEF